MEKPINVLLSDVEINYARLSRPVVNKFNQKEQYEAQIVLSDAQVAELNGHGLKTKEKNGVKFIQAKRNALKANGEDNGQVRVVDGDKRPFDANIGNGSRGNVILWVYPYSGPTGAGISASLTAVQVVDHVPQESGDSIDFDVVSGGSSEGADLF